MTRSSRAKILNLREPTPEEKACGCWRERNS
jgi:hypothetical protein